MHRERSKRNRDDLLQAGQDPQALIELRDVVKVFHNAAGEFTVLKGISAGFREGEFVSIVGRSGSGKSTLLNMMTGIDHPTSGTVRIGDVFLHTLSEGRMSVWRGRSMGIVFQFFQLLPMLTLLENVMLPMDFCEMYAPAEREGRAMGLLEMVGLQGLEHKYPAAIAGGQQQSAAVARALANDPPILVADEPTGNLDTRTAERILEIFEEQVAKRKTVLLVTHDNTLAQRAARRLVISDGELVHESLVRALPNLAHNHLLKLSHLVEVRRFAPGDLLYAANGSPAPALLVISSGQLEVVSGDNKVAAKKRQAAVEHLSAGDIFTQFDLAAVAERRGLLQRLRNSARGAAIHGLRVVDGPLEALCLDAPGLAAALQDMPDLKEALELLVRERSGEAPLSRNGEVTG
jgi:putative ABC transport system ATP-binding protein